MAKVPERDKDVYFVGAGLSAAFGLPVTQQLLREVDSDLAGRLLASYEHFYPIDSTQSAGFQPAVVDYFSLLQSHIAVTIPGDSSPLPGPPLENPEGLLRDLKWHITECLVAGVRSLDLSDTIPSLEKLFDPGNVIITTNWDFLLEAYAIEQGHRFRYQRHQEHDNHATILKLHGSVDWTLSNSRKRTDEDSRYAGLGHLVGSGAYAFGDQNVLRIRALEEPGRAWQRIKAGTTEPLLITMAPGKASELAPVRKLWNDAYWALSSARRIHFIGYSLPPDDIEIRALVLAGIQRGSKKVRAVSVQDPSPEVHNRFRSYIRTDINDIYVPFAKG
ncbi:MAG: SIR2 family protein [Dehalococcoidia bacterium]|nr:SIR2 family protein [Dehalococcoidia bacterium]